MKKNMNSLMAALTLMAIVLGVFLLTTPNKEARANMLNAQGEYTLITAGDGGDESLIIVDKDAQKMIVYKLVNGKNLNVMASFDFGKGMNGK